MHAFFYFLRGHRAANRKNIPFAQKMFDTARLICPNRGVYVLASGMTAGINGDEETAARLTAKSVSLIDDGHLKSADREYLIMVAAYWARYYAKKVGKPDESRELFDRYAANVNIHDISPRWLSLFPAVFLENWIGCEEYNLDAGLLAPINRKVLVNIAVVPLFLAAWSYWLLEELYIALSGIALGWVCLYLFYRSESASFLPKGPLIALIVVGLLITQILYPASLPAHVIVAAISAVIVFGVLRLGAITRQSDNLDFGAVMMMAAVGSWLGLMGSLAVLLVSGALLLLFERGGADSRESATFPWRHAGGYLAFALVLVWFFGPVIPFLAR